MHFDFHVFIFILIEICVSKQYRLRSDATEHQMSRFCLPSVDPDQTPRSAVSELGSALFVKAPKTHW